MTAIVRTVPEFDALPTGTLIVAVEYRTAGPHVFAIRSLWQNVGRGWVNLDPSDPDDGETAQPAVFLQNLLTGFDSHGVTHGVARVLGAGRDITEADAAQLAIGSYVATGDGPWTSDVFRHEGDGRWTLMDPTDPDNGDIPYTTAQMGSYNGGRLRLLYTPGDEGPRPS